MIAATVWKQLVTTLKENPALAGYIKEVFEGFRVKIEPENLPCIMIEPIQNNEIEQDMNQIKRIFFSVDVVAFTYCPSNQERQIVGDDSYKGILEIENDIRACLVASNTLGDSVVDIRFEPSVFDRYEEKYPTRGLLIPIRILFQQNNVA